MKMLEKLKNLHPPSSIFRLNGVKILLVLVTAFAALNCPGSEDDETSMADQPCDALNCPGSEDDETVNPIIGNWTGECELFSNGSERVQYTFTESTLLHLREAYIQSSPPATANCSMSMDAEITSQYDIVIGPSNDSVRVLDDSSPPMILATVNGLEIDYTLNSVEAIARTAMGVTALGGGSISIGETVDLGLIHTVARPRIGGQLYRSVLYIRTSVSPDQLYTLIGETSNPSPMARNLELKDDEFYEKQ